MPLLSRRTQFALLAAALGGLVPLGAYSSSSAAATSTGSNLLLGDTASFQHSVGTWVARNGTVGRPVAGVLALKSTSSQWSLASSGTAATATAALPNNVYTGTFSVRADSQGRSVSPGLMFFDRSGTQVGGAVGQAVSEVTSAWTPVVPVVGIAPATAVTVAVVEFVASPAVGELHYLRSPTLTVSVPTRRDVVGPLVTVGNQLYDANGPLVLRGLHRRGLELWTGSPAITAAEIGQAKRWGATLVRLSVSSAYWLPGTCNYDGNYVSKVDAAVKAVTSRHMVALVDLHTSTLGSCSRVQSLPMADSRALDFWSQVADHYKSNPLVAFDLYNEPHDISDAVWLHGGRVLKGAMLFTAAGMQNMYDAVRATGAQNVVVVSGNDWANRLPAAVVNGTNIVYGVHVYTCPTSTDPSTCTPNPLDPSPILNPWVARSATLPVAITEFGWPSKTDGRYIANVIAFAEAHGWGWDAFAWDGDTAGQFSLLATKDTFEPSPAGMPVLAGYAAS